MMSIDSLLALVTALPLAYFVFLFSQFQNQRWIRSRERNGEDNPIAVSLFRDFSGGLALAFGWVWIAAYGYDHDWGSALALAALSYLVIMPTMAALSGMVVGLAKGVFMDWAAKSVDENPNDLVLLWFIGTLALLPSIILLSSHVSWFGLFK